MKLYTGKIRTYKKFLGSHGRFEYLDWAYRTLDVGSLIRTCSGHNEIIKEISWDWRSHRSQLYIIDADIISESGRGCSLTHCCSKPPTKSELIQHYLSINLEEYEKWYKDYQANGWWPDEPFDKTLVSKVHRGDDVFNDNGTLK